MSELNEDLKITSCPSDSNGEITYANEVIATIVSTSISDVDGLCELVGGGVVDGITGMFGKKNPSKGVKVEFGKEEVKVSLSISVKYGFNVPKVCEDIQEKISKAIESMTGLKVIDISINVANIVVDESQTKNLSSK